VTAKMMQPMLGVLERSRDGERRQAVLDYAARNQLDRVTAHGDLDRIGIIAAGPTFLHVCEALRRMGLDDIELAQNGIRLLQLGMIDPIEPRTLNDFASGLQKIIVVEDKRPFIETAARDLLYGHNKGGPLIIGKRNIEDGPVFPSNGELTADVIAPVLAEILLGHSEVPSVRAWLDRRESPKSRLAQPLFLFGMSAQFVDEGA
jgi:indolepyruvate ferredoxin oxidoreductase